MPVLRSAGGGEGAKEEEEATGERGRKKSEEGWQVISRTPRL